MHKCHRLAKPFVVAALLSSLSFSAFALPTSPSWTSENYKLWYYVDDGTTSGTGDYPSPSGSTTPNISQIHDLVTSYSSGAILFDSVSNTYTMSVRTAGVDDSYELSSAYLDLGFDALAGAKLYVSYTLAGEALGVEGSNDNASGVQSSVVVNGVTTHWLGSVAGLYDDNDPNNGDLETIGIFDGLLEFNLVAGANSFYMDMDAFSDTSGTSPTETWLTAIFRFSLTPFDDPPAGTVPEPSGLALFALGLVGLAGVQRRRRLM